MAADHERIKNKVLTDYADRTVYELHDNKQAFGETESGFKAQFGLGKGTSDIVGFCVNTGLFVAIEVKTLAYKKLSKEQKAFLKRVYDSGGIALVAYQEFSETGYRLIKLTDYLYPY